MTRKTKNPARRVLFSLALLLLSCVAGAAQEPAAKLEEYMNASAKVDGFSGAVLVARDGKAVFSKGYGMADFENDVPATPRHKFRIGSLTKQFTAAAVLLLQERGKLSVQDSVCKHVAAPCPAAWQPVTLHHLLTHTSGVPDFTGFLDYRKNETLPTTPEGTLARFRELSLEFAPGERFKYSNSGYVLLGHVVERVSGTPYAEFLGREIFGPLGMAETGYDDPRRLIKQRAFGYTTAEGGELTNAAFMDMTIPHGAGALYSTVGDLLLWDQALYAEKLLPRRALAQMFTPAKNNYAYGWVSTRLFDRPLLTHNGGINGFKSNLMRFTDDRVTVVVLSNLETAPVDRVARDLAAVVFGGEYRVPAERAVAVVDPKLYDAYVGEYQLAPAFSVAVTKEGGRLFAQATGQPRFEIFPESETVFFLKVVEAKMTFQRDGGGRVTGFLLEQAGQRLPAKKVK